MFKNYDDVVADEIAIENDDNVFIIDASKDNGEIKFGIRKTLTFSDKELRNEYIGRLYNDAIRNGFIGDGLSSELRNRYDNDWRLRGGQNAEEELSNNKKQSESKQERNNGEIKSGIKFSKKQSNVDSDGNPLTKDQEEFKKNVGLNIIHIVYIKQSLIPSKTKK